MLSQEHLFLPVLSVLVGLKRAFYPFSSPGGWQLIGHTKQALFDKKQAQPTLLQAGDTVKFVVEGIEL